MVEKFWANSLDFNEKQNEVKKFSKFFFQCVKLKKIK